MKTEETELVILNNKCIRRRKILLRTERRGCRQRKCTQTTCISDSKISRKTFPPEGVRLLFHSFPPWIGGMSMSSSGAVKGGPCFWDQRRDGKEKGS